MLTVLALTFAVLGSAWQGEAPAAKPACLELVARLGESRLSAFNPGRHPQLLVLGELDGVARARTWLAPGGTLDARFAPGTLAGLALEVVSFTAHGMRSSGALALESIAAEGLDAFWVESNDAASRAWGRRGESLLALAPCDALLGGFALSMPAASPRAPRPTHVPVITPADRKNGNLPPRLEKKPLPPF